MSLKILFVDDDDVYWDLFQVALSRLTTDVKPEVHRLRDGNEVRAYLENCGSDTDTPWPELLILDQRMPIMDGTEVLEDLKSRPRERSIPVCMMSSSDEPRLIKQSYELGAAFFIIKPLRFRSLAGKIQQIIDFWTHVAERPPALA